MPPRTLIKHDVSIFKQMESNDDWFEMDQKARVASRRRKRASRGEAVAERTPRHFGVFISF